MVVDNTDPDQQINGPPSIPSFYERVFAQHNGFKLSVSKIKRMEDFRQIKHNDKIKIRKYKFTFKSFYSYTMMFTHFSYRFMTRQNREHINMPIRRQCLFEYRSSYVWRVHSNTLEWSVAVAPPWCMTNVFFCRCCWLATWGRFNRKMKQLKGDLNLYFIKIREVHLHLI